jgi:ATPase subunit of ABC transporter with duplicated ATPase domains
MGNKALIEARDLGYSYDGSADTVFTGASFAVYAGDKAALLGDNGSGKTTLLRLLAGELEPARGELLNRGASVFLLRQEDAAMGDLSAEAWLLEASGADGWEGLPRVAAAAAALGFAPAELARPVGTFSGGERKMLAITAGLLRAPDLYLLDEPTNYLDGAGMARLAAALRGYKGGFMVVSHDRAFLDACVGKVFELKRSAFGVYAGGYSAYARRKEEELARATWKKEKIEREIADLRVTERNYRDWGAAKEKEKKGAQGFHRRARGAPAEKVRPRGRTRPRQDRRTAAGEAVRGESAARAAAGRGRRLPGGARPCGPGRAAGVVQGRLVLP